jgi:hypothetical protein
MTLVATDAERKLMDESQYKGIELWHARTGSRPYYIIDRQRKAKEDGAPLDAIYFHHDSGRWVCVSYLAKDNPFVAAYEHMMHDRREV